MLNEGAEKSNRVIRGAKQTPGATRACSVDSGFIERLFGTGKMVDTISVSRKLKGITCGLRNRSSFGDQRKDANDHENYREQLTRTIMYQLLFNGHWYKIYSPVCCFRDCSSSLSLSA